MLPFKFPPRSRITYNIITVRKNKSWKDTTSSKSAWKRKNICESSTPRKTDKIGMEVNDILGIQD